MENIDGRKLINGEPYSLFMLQLVPKIKRKLDALLRVPRQSLYWEALAILQLSLNVLYLKCEKFNLIDVLKLFCLRLHFLESINSLLLLHGPLARKMSQDRYVSLWTFQSLFFSLCHCCCLFVFSISQTRETFWISYYGGSWQRATLGSVNLFKIIQGISQVWENAQT